MRNAYLMMHPETKDRQCDRGADRIIASRGEYYHCTEPWLKEALDGQVKFDAVSAPDFVIAVGGDGTFLTAVQTALRMDIPVLGVNIGHIGFLIEIDMEQLPAICKRLKTGDFNIDNRMMLDVVRGGHTDRNGVKRRRHQPRGLRSG